MPLILLTKLGPLHAAIFTGCYELHIQRVIKKLYGAVFLILHGLSSRRVNIMHKVFVCYIHPIIEFIAVFWFYHTVMQHQQV